MHLTEVGYPRKLHCSATSPLCLVLLMTHWFDAFANHKTRFPPQTQCYFPSSLRSARFLPLFYFHFPP